MPNYAVYDPSDTIVANRVTSWLPSKDPSDPEVPTSGDYLTHPTVEATGHMPYWKVSGAVVVDMLSGEIDDWSDHISYGDENYQVKEYTSNRLTTETWYNTDNGDGTYSGKVREITYSYTNNKLTSKTEKTFFLDGTEDTSETWDYFEDSNKEIMKRG